MQLEVNESQQKVIERVDINESQETHSNHLLNFSLTVQSVQFDSYEQGIDKELFRPVQSAKCKVNGEKPD